MLVGHEEPCLRGAAVGAQFRERSSKRKRRACAPPLPSSPWSRRLREQLEHRLLRLVRIDKAEIDNCWRVCRVSRFALSRFWSARTRLSDRSAAVDEVLGEVRTRLDGRGVGTEGLGLSSHGRQRGVIAVMVLVILVSDWNPVRRYR